MGKEVVKMSRFLMLRDWLLDVGAGSPYDFWKYLRGRGVKVSYLTVVKYFWEARDLGLIELVAEVPNSKGSPIKKKIYRVVPGKENDGRWFLG